VTRSWQPRGKRLCLLNVFLKVISSDLIRQSEESAEFWELLMGQANTVESDVLVEEFSESDV